MRGCWRGAERAGERGAFAAAVNAQTALNLVSLLASRSAAAARRSSASFCAVEASVRVGPLDSLRTCERKRRRLNARGRPSFNCLPLVTGVEKAPAEAGGERGGGGRCARSPSRERFPHFLPAILSRHQSRPTANLSQRASSAWLPRSRESLHALTLLAPRRFSCFVKGVLLDDTSEIVARF